MNFQLSPRHAPAPPLDVCHILRLPSDVSSLARPDLARCIILASLAWAFLRIRFSSPNLKHCLRQKHQNHAVSAQEEFADEAVAVDGLALLSIRVPGRLAPHFLDVLQNHVAVTIEGLDTREQFAVVAGRNEDLGVVAHGGLEERERA